MLGLRPLKTLKNATDVICSSDIEGIVRRFD